MTFLFPEPTRPLKFYSIDAQLTTVGFSIADPVYQGEAVVFDFFKVSIGVGDSLPFKEAFIPSDMKMYTFRNLLPGTGYTLYVAAVTGTDESAQTSESLTTVVTTGEVDLQVSKACQSYIAHAAVHFTPNFQHYLFKNLFKENKYFKMTHFTETWWLLSSKIARGGLHIN